MFHSWEWTLFRSSFNATWATYLSQNVSINIKWLLHIHYISCWQAKHISNCLWMHYTWVTMHNYQSTKLCLIKVPMHFDFPLWRLTLLMIAARKATQKRSCREVSDTCFWGFYISASRPRISNFISNTLSIPCPVIVGNDQ